MAFTGTYHLSLDNYTYHFTHAIKLFFIFYFRFRETMLKSEKEIMS